MRTRAEELESLWNEFEKLAVTIPEINTDNFADIKKLMTLEYVIDIGRHEFFIYADFVHLLSKQLLELKEAKVAKIEECCTFWLNMLKGRNQFPLSVKHHQSLDGECDFALSLELMEDKPSRFQEIQVVNNATPELMHAMHKLDCLAFGLSFGELPGVNNTVLASLIEFNDSIFLVAKDQYDRHIGHLWGVLLRDVEIDKQHKANVFWWMELARDPDYSDINVNVGEELRNRMFEILKARQDWQFIGYQHILNHKFHMRIVGQEQDGAEFVSCNNEKLIAKSEFRYDEDINSHMRVQFIRSNDSNLPFPPYKNIRPAILKSFWQARHSLLDFARGAYSFFKRNKNQQTHHNLLDEPIEHRLAEKISIEKQICDWEILKQIVASNTFGNNPPELLNRLRSLLDSDQMDFRILKSYVENRGKTKHLVLEALCQSIVTADTPTFAINMLLKSGVTPTAWLAIIDNQRNLIPSARKLK